MKFDVIVGNPPYGRDKIGSRRLHFKIIESSVSVFDKFLCFVMPSKCLYDFKMKYERKLLKHLGCEKIYIVDEGTFSETQMTEPAIYFCRKGSKQTDDKLNVYDNILINDVERKIFEIMDTGTSMWTNTVTMYGDWKKYYYNWNKEKDLRKMKNYSWFLNVSYANYKENGEWIAQKKLNGVGVLDLDSEINFIKTNGVPKVVICFHDRKSAENVARLIEGCLLKFCLWICQDDRNMKSKVWKLFPDIDYSDVESDEILLKKLGCDDEWIKKILVYLSDFDFEKKRKDRCIKQYDYKN